MVLSAVFVCVSTTCAIALAIALVLISVLLGSHDIKCSIDESTGSALRDLRKDPSPGVIATDGGAIACYALFEGAQFAWRPVSNAHLPKHSFFVNLRVYQETPADQML